jgi:hypothetical protein
MANNPYDKLDPQQAETYAKLIAQIRREAEKLSKLKDNMVKGDKIQAELIEEQNKQLTKLRDRYKTYIGKLQKGNEALKEQNDRMSSIASTVNNMPKMYKEFGNQLKGSLTISDQINTSIDSIKDTGLKGFANDFNEGLKSAFESLTDYAQLNSSDSEEIKAKSTEIANQYKVLQSMLPLIEESAELSEAQKQHFRDGAASLATLTTQAGKFANQSKEFKEVYGTLVDDLNGVGNGFRKIAATIELMFNNGRVAAAALLYGIGKIVDEFGELGKEIGVGVTQMIGLKLQALAFSKIFGETSKDAVLDLQAALGDFRSTSFGLNLDAATLAANYKLSGEQAAYMATVFGKVSGNSDSVGKNTIAFTKQLALTNGIMPTRAFQDIAENSEFISLYTNESGKNIGTAAVAAAKLGVNLKTASTIANHLLDYQTSVDKEMEASVLLGREFNLQKARQLAYEGDIAGSMKEALNAAGGIDEFMSLDPIRRKAVADALGVSVTELQKMVSQQRDLNGMNGVGAQIYSRIEETLQALGNSLGGKIFNGLAAMVLFAGQLNMALMGTGLSIGGMIKSMGTFIAQLAKAAAMKLGLMGPEMVMSKAGDMYRADSPQGKVIKTAAKARAAKAASTSVADSITPTSTNKTSAGVNKLGGAGGGINASGLLKGAAAILIMAGALFVLGKALQEFNAVEPASLLKMTGALLIMGGAMVGLSAIFANPVLSAGLGIATLGMLGFGAAILLVGGGFKMFSQGVSILIGSLPLLATSLQPLIGMILPIFGLAAAISALSVSLIALSASGALALPVLAAVGVAAGVATAVFGGGGGNDNSDLLAEIKGLRADLNSGKVAVNMDGKKVNTALAINNRRQGM